MCREPFQTPPFRFDDSLENCDSNAGSALSTFAVVVFAWDFGRWQMPWERTRMRMLVPIFGASPATDEALSWYNRCQHEH
jgi:hypothetical protein